MGKRSTKKPRRKYDSARCSDAFWAASKAAQKHLHKPSDHPTRGAFGYARPAGMAPENYVCSGCGAPWTEPHVCAEVS